jgi:hypothetical protein
MEAEVCRWLSPSDRLEQADRGAGRNTKKLLSKCMSLFCSEEIGNGEQFQE